MAELPSWLAFEPITQVMARGAQAASQMQQQDIARQELAQRMALEQQRMQQASALAQLNAATEQQRLGMQAQELAETLAFNRERLAQDRAGDDLRARQAAMSFQAIQDLQRDISAGVPVRDAYLKYLPAISPNTLAQAIPEQQLFPTSAVGVGRPTGIPGQVFTPVTTSSGVVSIDQSFIDPNESAKLKALEQELDPIVRAVLREETAAIRSAIDMTPQERDQAFDELAKRARRADAEVKARNRLPRPATREERDRLPSGTKYIDPQGNVAIKQ